MKKGTKIFLIILLSIILFGLGICGGYLMKKSSAAKCKDEPKQEEKKKESDGKFDYDCKHFENDGTEDGRDECTYTYKKELHDKEYEIKYLNEYDGEGKTYGYTYTVYINGEKMVTSRTEEPSIRELSGDYILIDNNDWWNGRILYIVSLSNLKDIKQLNESDGSVDVIDLNDWALYDGNEYYYYGVCDSPVVKIHQVDLKNAFKDKVIYEEQGHEACSQED